VALLTLLSFAMFLSLLLNQAKPKVARENLSTPEGAASARLSLELVQIRTSIANSSTRRPLHELRVPSASAMSAGVEASWAEMEFSSLLRRLRALHK
jgi:hypothetical protein